MEQPLPIRILSTRALGNAARDFIHQQDWLVDIVSMIEIHGVIKVEQIATFLKHGNATGNNFVLLFSSENAVKWLKWGFDKFGFKMPLGLKAVSVGEKALNTAVELLGVEALFAEKNSEVLLHKLKAAFSFGTSFIFFCGNKRLDNLPLGLLEAGFAVEEFVVYETVLTPHKINREYDIFLFFSPSAVESFFRVNNWNAKNVAVSIGHTTSDALKKAAVENILVAKEPNELSMLFKLQEYLFTT
jgi:uroporphyrinogen-III synthase